jgi:hypothetical protein
MQLIAEFVERMAVEDVEWTLAGLLQDGGLAQGSKKEHLRK